MPNISALCVFCGASNNIPEAFLDTAAQFGTMLAKKKIRLVYGGGNSGVMGALADSVLKSNGLVTGVFPRSLKNLETEHHSLTEIIKVESMHERKRIMFERSDAILVLPGGCGTLDEMFEIITWKQLRFHNKPIVIFNHLGYWNPLIALLENIINNGFARAETRSFYTVVDTLEDVFKAINVSDLDGI